MWTSSTPRSRHGQPRKEEETRPTVRSKQNLKHMIPVDEPHQQFKPEHPEHQRTLPCSVPHEATLRPLADCEGFYPDKNCSGSFVFSDTNGNMSHMKYSPALSRCFAGPGENKNKKLRIAFVFLVFLCYPRTNFRNKQKEMTKTKETTLMAFFAFSLRNRFCFVFYLFFFPRFLRPSTAVPPWQAADEEERSIHDQPLGAREGLEPV